jgi:hypothetical protein
MMRQVFLKPLAMEQIVGTLKCKIVGTLKCKMFLVSVMKDAKGMAIRNDHADVARILDNEITKAERAMVIIANSFREEYDKLSAEVKSYIQDRFAPNDGCT